MKSRWKQFNQALDAAAQEIFGQALDIADQTERRTFLDRACADDATLRWEVESLLAANSAAGEFLQHSAPVEMDTPQRARYRSLLSETAGTRIGRYKLLEQIGEGGFGVVWMAQEEEPVRRRVALKFVKLGMDTKEVVARFEAEREALAMMDHPNIAREFDGGATDTGRPYFAMELVKGVPITEYCDANKLSTADRLLLFMQVCHAVQHAHQKGVIHLDLKPSNILVTVQNEHPMPKVIDFGVARAMQARPAGKTLSTRCNQWLGTPAYMSPEQAGLGSLEVDTRSDVYSLGVLLYELLTGGTPFETQMLLTGGYDAVMRTIREEQPPWPSTRLITLSVEKLGQVASNRQAEPARLNRLLRGDLDRIVMKALEKDRTRRYESASAFARDLEGCLHHEPVGAATPSAGCRARRFIARTRMTIGSSAALALNHLGRTIFNTWQAPQATQAVPDTDQARTTEVRLRQLPEPNRKTAQDKALTIWDVVRILNSMLNGAGESVARRRRNNRAARNPRSDRGPHRQEPERPARSMGQIPASNRRFPLTRPESRLSAHALIPGNLHISQLFY